MAVGFDPRASSPPPATGTPPAREASPTGLSGARSEIQENSSDNSSQESLCTCISRIISQLWAIIRQCFCGATGGDTTTTEEAASRIPLTRGREVIASHGQFITQMIHDLPRGVVFMKIKYNGASTISCALVSSPEERETFIATCRQNLTDLLAQDGNINCNDGPLEVRVRIATKNPNGSFNLHSASSKTEHVGRVSISSGQNSYLIRDADNMRRLLQQMLCLFAPEGAERRAADAAITTLTEEPTRTMTPPQESQITGDASSPSNPTTTGEPTRTTTPPQESQITDGASSNPTPTEEASRTMTPPQESQITDGASSNPTATQVAAWDEEARKIPLTCGRKIIASQKEYIIHKICDLQRGLVFMTIKYNDASTISCALVSSLEELETFIATCRQSLTDLLVRDGNSNCYDGPLGVAVRVATKNSDGGFNVHFSHSKTECVATADPMCVGAKSHLFGTADGMRRYLKPTLRLFASESIEITAAHTAITTFLE